MIEPVKNPDFEPVKNPDLDQKKLKKLANLLRKDAVNPEGIQFDMHDWGAVSNPRKPMSCGTTACAMGLAAISKTFKGLDYDPQSADFYWKGAPIYGIDAAMHLFGLTYNQAVTLFSGGGMKRSTGGEAEKEEARRIEYLLETGMIPFYDIDFHLYEYHDANSRVFDLVDGHFVFSRSR
jgi:hypothetical protein